MSTFDLPDQMRIPTGSPGSGAGFQPAGSWDRQDASQQSVNYVVITPARNEGNHLSTTIESMAAQTMLPMLWVVVDDGSTDNTKEVAEDAARQYPWIRVVHRPDRGFRKPGEGVIEAFLEGYAILSEECPLSSDGTGIKGDGPAWDFLAKLDGDLAFEPDYFQKCLAHFQTDPKLGVGGGRVYSNVNGALVDDSPNDPPFHVRGATKIYRRAAWKAIGGLLPATGWDTLDEFRANMLGWKSYSFRELAVRQLKPTGSADGTWKNWYKNGRANYVAGYHPLFMISKCIRRLFHKPYGICALGLICGFVGSYWNGVPRVADQQLIHYVRKQQMNRLLLRHSLWS